MPYVCVCMCVCIWLQIEKGTSFNLWFLNGDKFKDANSSAKFLRLSVVEGGC